MTLPFDDFINSINTILIIQSDSERPGGFRIEPQYQGNRQTVLESTTMTSQKTAGEMPSQNEETSAHTKNAIIAKLQVTVRFLLPDSANQVSSALLLLLCINQQIQTNIKHQRKGRK